MRRTIERIKSLRLKGAPVTCLVINAIAKGIVMANDQTILVENGGYLTLSADWARNILYMIEKEEKKMVRRIGNTAKIPSAPAILSETKLHFQQKLKDVQVLYNIPDELIIHFDQTPLAFVCSPNHTLDFQGNHSIPLVGKGKKKQITGTFAISMSGSFLPMQVMYEGKTQRCLPQGIEFPEGFDVTFTPNQWSNEEKALEYVQKLIFPYIKRRKEEVKLEDNHKALLLFDVFNGQKTQAVIDLIDEYTCLPVFVPPNVTHIFQPLDLALNAKAKRFLNEKFEAWYSQEVTKLLNEGSDVYAINITVNVSVMKPIHARWPMHFYDHMQNQVDLIKQSFYMAGIYDAIAMPLPGEDPFIDLI